MTYIAIYQIVLVFFSFQNFTNGTRGKSSIDKTIDTFNKIGGALMRQMVAGKFFSIYQCSAHFRKQSAVFISGNVYVSTYDNKIMGFALDCY